MDPRTRRGVSTLLALLTATAALAAAREDPATASDGKEEAVAKVTVLEPLPREEVVAASSARPDPEMAGGVERPPQPRSGDVAPRDAAPRDAAEPRAVVAPPWAEPPATEALEAVEPGPGEARGREREQVIDVVWSWAEAWSQQEVDLYLSLYAEGFLVPDGLSRKQWEERRRQRLSAPRFIDVEISALGGPYELEPDRMMVSFRQEYTSDGYSDVVLKTLELVREDGSWRILSETARPWR